MVSTKKKYSWSFHTTETEITSGLMGHLALISFLGYYEQTYWEISG